MKKIFSILLLAASSCFSQNFTLPVWPNGAPGAKDDPTYTEDTVYTESGAPRIRNVSRPMLYVFLPEEHQKSRAAVVICPGGGYMRLAIDPEGFDVAKWCNDIGMVGIVLKYRLPSDRIMTDKTIGPLQDVQEAIRIVRRHADEWGIDPSTVGVAGFSAGGHLAATASTLFNDRVSPSVDSVSARPDFSILIYPVITMDSGTTHAGSRRYLLGEHASSSMVEKFSAERQVTSETPPAFLVHAVDDRTVPVDNSIQYARALHRFSIPVELHLYESGGHGFGLGAGKGTASRWPDACRAWLQQHRFLPR